MQFTKSTLVVLFSLACRALVEDVVAMDVVHDVRVLPAIVNHATGAKAAVALEAEGHALRKEADLALSSASRKELSKAKIEAEMPTKSVIRPLVMESDGVTQGKVGSCHIFATQTLLKDATGLTVSAARMFLDHLIGYGMLGGKTETVNGIKKWNMEHVLDQRGLPTSALEHCGFGEWEGGFIDRNMNLLRTVGGVIVPNNNDWKTVETMMEKIDKERVLQINSPAPITRSAADKLSKNGLQEIVDAAVSPTDFEGRNILTDRGLVQMQAWNLKTEQVKFTGNRRLATPEAIQQGINTFVKTLETNAIFLAVDTKKYWPVIYKGKKWTPAAKELLTTDVDHAICIVGYEISKNVFFVKDSNIPHVIAVPAEQLVLSTGYAFILRKINDIPMGKLPGHLYPGKL